MRLGLPSLTVMTCSLTERAASLAKLQISLDSQRRECEADGLGTLEHLVRIDSGEMTPAEKIREMTREASSDYVACVDDDDRVASCYLRSILCEIRQAPLSLQPDVITFLLLNTHDGSTWEFKANARDGSDPDRDCGRRVMCANHVCIWKKSLAEKAPWVPRLYGADVLWYRALNAANPSLTSCHILKTLYLYEYSPSGTRTQTSRGIEESMKRYWGGVGIYRHRRTGGLFVADEGDDVARGQSVKRVWDAGGTLSSVPKSELDRIDTVNFC